MSERRFTDEALTAVENEVKSLVKWCEQNMNWATVKVNPRTQKDLLDGMLLLIDEVRTLYGKENEE